MTIFRIEEKTPRSLSHWGMFDVGRRSEQLTLFDTSDERSLRSEYYVGYPPYRNPIISEVPLDTSDIDREKADNRAIEAAGFQFDWDTLEPIQYDCYSEQPSLLSRALNWLTGQ